MSDPKIWRYISLAKYVDLLRTQSLFFPKASTFLDTTEGKWGASVLLKALEKDDVRLKDYEQQLEELLARAGHDPSVILDEAIALLESEYVQGVFRDVLWTVVHSPLLPHKRREYLELMLSGWKSVLQTHINRRHTWISDIETYRESTYISCWNQLDSMSLAMWEQYGKGQEGVALRSTKSKLTAAIECNSALLEEHGLIGEAVAVEYFDFLGTLSKETQDRVEDIFMNGLGLPPTLFSIKSNIYEYEHEIRVVLYPKRDAFAAITNPYPDCLGFELPVGKLDAKSEPSVIRFLDAVHIYPTLGRDSTIFRIVSEINRRFGMERIEVFAEPILPFQE